MIPTIFRYDSPHQANPYQKINSDTIHYGFPGQNHNPVLRFNPIPIQSNPMKSRFKHLENGVHGKSTKRRLHDISIRDFSTMNLLFNHELFNHELFTHELFNHELINHEISKSSGIEKSRTVGWSVLHGWRIHGWRIHGWRIHGWRLFRLRSEVEA